MRGFCNGSTERLHLVASTTGLGYLMSGGPAAPVNERVPLGHSGLTAMDHTRTGHLQLGLHTPLGARQCKGHNVQGPLEASTEFNHWIDSRSDVQANDGQQPQVKGSAYDIRQKRQV
ncbi:MAG: hypothetical protein FRX49_07204 [Trebouxia sp. A1-2]|nr:MAG: hypothetical protein FRX49_07204 [Trebouxia sp. A1-2]